MDKIQKSLLLKRIIRSFSNTTFIYSTINNFISKKVLSGLIKYNCACYELCWHDNGEYRKRNTDRMRLNSRRLILNIN